MYADLLKLRLYVLRLNHSLLSDLKLGFDVYFKQPFLMFTSLTSTLFLTFSMVLSYPASLINFHNAFTSLLPFSSASIPFCALNLIYGFNHYNLLNSNTQCICFSFSSSLE